MNLPVMNFAVILILLSAMVMVSRGDEYQYGYQGGFNQQGPPKSPYFGGFVTPSPFKPNFNRQNVPIFNPQNVHGYGRSLGGRSGNVNGGVGNEKPPTSKERAIMQMVAYELKPKALKSLNPKDVLNSNTFEEAEILLLSFATQTVAGTNYFFKIKIEDYIFHAKVYRDLSKKLSVKAVKPMSETDSLIFF